MWSNFSSEARLSSASLAALAALTASAASSSSVSSNAAAAAAAAGIGGEKSSTAFGSIRPSTTSSMRICSRRIFSACAITSAIVVGQAEIAITMCLRPFSMRLAISISPSRVSSSTEPISRMYIRTGSVVRPNSESTVDRAASASSSASSSDVTTAGCSVMSSASASGARS